LCGAARRRCSKWALKDSTRCKFHGGYNKKHRKYDDYGIPINFYTPEELKELRANIDSGKKHEQLIYQMAHMVFKRMISEAGDRDDSEMFVFQLACEHFEKISKTMSSIEKNAEAQPPIIHTHKFDEAGSAMYEKRLTDFAGQMVKNILIIIFAVIRTEPNGEGLVGKMKEKLPPPIIKLMDEEQEAEPAVSQ